MFKSKNVCLNLHDQVHTVPDYKGGRRQEQKKGSGRGSGKGRQEQGNLEC